MTTDLKTVYIEGFPRDSDEKVLRRLFSEIGKTKSIHIPNFHPDHPLNKNRGRLRLKGYAFVEFLTEDDAKKAYEIFEDTREKLTRSDPADASDNTSVPTIIDRSVDSLRNKIYLDSDYKSLLPLRVIPRQTHLILTQLYKEQKLQTLIRAAKLLFVPPV